jgi:hypothetical protein
VASGIPARLTPAEGRKFGLTVGIAFGVLATISWWRGHEIPVYVFGGLSAALILAGLVIPGHLSGVNRAWMGFAEILSKFTTPIFMGIVFFLVILPVGLIMRVFGHNPMRHKAENRSYWAPRSEARGNMTNQF